MSPDPGGRATSRVIVVGAGVSGLTSALELARAGFDVEVWGEKIGRATTSGVAAALWFPYRVAPADRVAGWAHVSHTRFVELSDEPTSGVRVWPLTEMFPDRAPDPVWRAGLTGFRAARVDELPTGFAAGFVYDVPVVDTGCYLPWLLAQLESAGVSVMARRVESLGEGFGAGADLVIHASGLGAMELANDTEMTPVRGQIAIARGATVERAWVDDHGPRGVRYIVPREHDVVIGGSVQEGSRETHIDDATTRRLMAAGAELEPGLAQAPSTEGRAGVRPCRTEVRLELEHSAAGPVIHNYGHGGAGITLSWGCAAEVARRARACVDGRQRALVGR